MAASGLTARRIMTARLAVQSSSYRFSTRTMKGLGKQVGRRKRSISAQNLEPMNRRAQDLVRGQPDLLGGAQVISGCLTKARFKTVAILEGHKFHFGVEDDIVAIRPSDNLKRAQRPFAARMDQKVLTRSQMTSKLRQS